ncbi:MAG: DUF4347 domain-containing protein [Burkholderiales bacterium]|nr:DUF4347 domain-containing protein [Burkholderiales bacterium]
MRQRPTIESLEPRILYSADLGPLLASAVVGPGAAEQRVVDPHLEFAAQNEQAVQNAPHEIVFIDARTPDYALLVQDITAQSGRQVDVVMLDAGRDGLAQISEALAGRENVAALHIIGHGGDGVIQLGNELVTADSLQGNPDRVESWAKALTADADILLYGCDVAATAQGRLLADTLARLTGADVAASDDATGHTSLGGDWKLEYATGAIDVPVALSVSEQDAWSHLLPSIVLTSYEPSFASMADNVYEISGSGSTWSQSFKYTSGAGFYSVDQIDLVLYKNVSPAGGNITIELRSSLGGGSGIIETGTVARRSLGTSEAWMSVSLSAPATLADGTTYYVSVKGVGGGNVYVGVASPGYPGGTFFANATAQPAKDLAFRVVSNPAPVVDLNGAAGVGQDEVAAFTEQTPVLIAPSGTIVDFDSANLASLTATITAWPDGNAVESLALNAAATAAAGGAGLTVDYTAATGVLSITGPATVATYQTILQGIQYNNTSDAPTTTDRIVSVVASDGTTPSVERFSFITVSAVNDAPVNTVPGAQSTAEDTALVFSVAGGNAISIADVDAGTNPVQVALTGTNGVITLAGIAGLTFSVGDGMADGTMTFTGTVAAINTALNGLSFIPAANFNGGASLSITTNDQGNTGTGGAQSDTDAMTITVTAVNDAPTGADKAVTTNEDTAYVFSAADFGFSDVDAGDSLSAVRIDALPGAGTLKLSGVAVTATEVITAASIPNLTFEPGLNGNGVGYASFTFSVRDQANAFAAAPNAITVDVTAVNDEPVVDLNAGGAGQDVTVAFTEQTPVLIAPVATLADVDSANLASLTVTLTARPDGDAVESLSATVTGGLTVSYTAGTGVLSITGSATVATYQSILQSIRYDNTSETPTTTDRLVTVVASDGTTPSATQTSSITVTAVNDAPVVDLNAGSAGQDVTVAFTEQTPVLIAPAGTLADVDSANLASLIVTLTARPDGDAVESLALDAAAATGGAGLTVSYAAASGVLSITGPATVATYQTILQGIQYTNISEAPSTVSRAVTVLAHDGVLTAATQTSTVTVTPVNDAPVNAVPGAQSANEDSALVFSVGNGNAISVGDADAGAGSVQVTLNGTNGDITLAGTAGLTFSAGDGTADGAMTFSGTVTAINAALNGLSFMPGANYSGAASLSITSSDLGNTGAGGSLSDSDAVAITVLPNVAPTVTASGGTTAFTEGNNVASAPVVLDDAVTVSDPDSTTLASATVSIGAGWQAAEDVLGFANNPATMGNISGSYNAATGVLSLSSASATATLAQWQAALRSVTYTNTSDMPSTAVRTVSVVVTGEGGSSAASTQSVAVTSVNDAPVVTASPGTATYITAGVPILVDDNVAVADLDNVTLASATVSIGAGFRAAEDALGFTNNPATMGNIAGGYNAASGALSLNSAGATATLAQWQAALRAVTYSNASAVPFNGTRTVSFELSDGAASSPVVTHALAVSVITLVDLLPPSTSPQQSASPAAPGATVVVTPQAGGNAPQQSQPASTTGRPVVPAGGTSLPIDAEFLPLAVNSSVFASIGGSLQMLAASAGLPEYRLQTYGIAAPGAEVVRELIADVLKQIEVRPLDLFQLGEQQGRLAGAVGLGVDLARLQDSLREQDEIQTRTIATLTAGSLSMTAAYVIWLIRGGALAASMLSALPAWRLLDPLPILARVDDEDDETSEEDEQAIASFSEVPVDAKRT